MWFEAISWLKINLAKSELILVNNIPYVEDLVVELRCRKGSFLLYIWVGESPEETSYVEKTISF